MNKKVIAITGASSGIGRYTASALMNMGNTVYDLSRRYIPNGKVKYIKTDVTDEENVKASIDEIIRAKALRHFRQRNSAGGYMHRVYKRTKQIISR